MTDVDVGFAGDGDEEVLEAMPEPLVRRGVSGLYVNRRVPQVAGPFLAAPALPQEEAEEEDGPGTLVPELPAEFPVPLAPRHGLALDELRLDVDGRYPQMAASGTIRSGVQHRVDWAARLSPVGPRTWDGAIFLKRGTASLLPQTRLRIKVSGAQPTHRKATVVFSGAGGRVRRIYRFKSPTYREVQFEYDFEQGQTATTSINTHAHPNRPAGLPAESLSIERVFERAGFAVAQSGGGGPIPTSRAGADHIWTDQEMHDAMQVFWTQFSDAPRWSLWVFWARQHIQGRSLGGVMFDEIGPNHRQGTAIFNDSFIADAPANDPNPAKWVERMRFWTAVHEMGHAFNMAHSWQKSLGNPWLPLADEPEARSFMNYPFEVAGGESAFFADFEYRFSDMELLFLRHAPESFVQMGNADWFDEHGFEQAAAPPQPELALTARVNRAEPVFAFMEPPVIELKLENVSSRPQVIEGSKLHSFHDLTVIVKRHQRRAREWKPFARYCVEPDTTLMKPGESVYQALIPTAGVNGWLIDEPGWYLIQVALHLDDQDVVSNPLWIRVTPPTDRAQEELAQEFFGEPVARILAFEGSRVLDKGNEVLRRVVEEVPEHPAAIHAAYALAAPLLSDGLTLDVSGKAGTAGPREGELKFASAKAKSDEGRELVEQALNAKPAAAAETFGNILYHQRADRAAERLAASGGKQAAKQLRDGMRKTLKGRKVPARYLSDG